MTKLMTQMKQALQTFALFLVGAIVAGFGFMMMILLAMFSLAMLAIAMIIAPFTKGIDLGQFQPKPFQDKPFQDQSAEQKTETAKAA